MVMVAFHSQNSIAVVTLCLVLLLSTTICAREHVAMSKSRQQVGMRGNDSRLLQNSRRRRIEQVQKERPGIYREIGSTLGGPKSSKATPVPIPSTPVVEDNETSNTEGVSAAIEEATEAESVGSTTEATEDVESVGSTTEATEDVESVSPVTEEAAETESVSSSTEETAEIAESESSNTGETAEVVDASSSSFVITVPSETSEEVVESVDDSTDESGCNSVAAQEPPPLESSSRESTFSMTVDVVYEEFSLTTKEIESYLNDQSIPMALWIVDCEGKDSDNTIETAEGKLRRLVGETSTITYSQLGSWEATGPCLEDNSSEPLCQQGFASSIQLYASHEASTEDLTHQIAEAFGATSKPYLESQQSVESVSIVDISLSTVQDSTNAISVNPNQTTPVRNRSTTKIVMGTIAGACLLSSLIIFILIGIYRRRRRAMEPRTNKDVAHVPFEDEFDGDAEVMDRITATNKGAGKRNDQQDDSDDSLPCPYALGIPVPYDERRMCSSATCPDCERLRREGIVGRGPSAPVQFSAPTSFEPQWWKLRPDADASRRNYEHEDAMEL